MNWREADVLRRAIRRLVRAELKDSWKGAGYPEDIPGIEARMKVERKRVNDLISQHTEKQGSGLTECDMGDSYE